MGRPGRFDAIPADRSDGHGASAVDPSKSRARIPCFQGLAGGFPGDRNAQAALRSAPSVTLLVVPLPRFAIAARGRRGLGGFPPLRVSTGQGQYVQIKLVDLEAVVGTVRFRPHDQSIAQSLPVVHDLFQIASRPGQRTAAGPIEGRRRRAPESGALRWIPASRGRRIKRRRRPSPAARRDSRRSRGRRSPGPSWPRSTARERRRR